jgi:hypothetical protein
METNMAGNSFGIMKNPDLFPGRFVFCDQRYDGGRAGFTGKSKWPFARQQIILILYI